MKEKEYDNPKFIRGFIAGMFTGSVIAVIFVLSAVYVLGGL